VVTTLTNVLSLLNRCNVPAGAQDQLLRITNQEQEMPLHRALRYGRSNTKYTDQDVHQLLTRYPEASRHENVKGELPLHLARKHQCPSKLYSYVTKLLAANVEAAASIDPVHKVAPFILAAMGREVHGKQGEYASCLSSTVALLRTNPVMM
jgi:hypothetical protein